MINRYETKQISKIWDKEKKTKLWLEFQLSVCEALCELKIIPLDDLNKIKKNAQINLPLMNKIEAETMHDVIAFTRMLSNNLGNESRWIHFGLTSTDMVDTVLNLQIKMSNEIIVSSLNELKIELKTKALKYKNQKIMGRTHGIFAEPTSLGLKFALWYDEINRQLERLDLARKQIEIVKITGSTGNFAHIEPKVSKIVAAKLKMNTDSCATQVVQRDRHSFLLSILANVATTIEKMAIEIRNSQRSEVNELLEGFETSQKGSSSMPHKKNPIGSENICGLARLIRGYASVSYENNLLWYERDISHSSNERIIFPDTYHLLHFIINRMKKIMGSLVINVDSINLNINKANSIFFSQPVLLAIIKNNSDISREEAYDYIQNCALIAQKQNLDFKFVLKENNINKYLSEKNLNNCYNSDNFLKNVDYIFNQVFN